jgi:hypothetical protein
MIEKLLSCRKRKLAWCPVYKAGTTTWMEIFAIIGGVMTPENRMRLNKGLIQMNQLARMVYPKTKDTNTTVKVKHATTMEMSKHQKILGEQMENNKSLKIPYTDLLMHFLGCDFNRCIHKEEIYMILIKMHVTSLPKRYLLSMGNLSNFKTLDPC